MLISNNSFVSAALLMSAGITILASIHAAFSASKGSRRALYLVFAAMNAGISAYILGAAALYASTDLPQAIFAMKLQMAGVIFSLIFFLPFVDQYFAPGKLLKREYLYVSVPAAFLFVANFYFPFGLRFSSFERGLDIVLPWGEILPTFSGEVNPVINIFRILGMGSVIWAAYKGFTLVRAKKIAEGYSLAVCCALLLAASVWGWLIDTGRIESFYVLGFAYLALVVQMSRVIGGELEHFISLDKVNSEKIRIAATTFSNHHPIMITDEHRNLVQVNHAFEQLTGYTADEVIGKNPRFLNSGRHDPEFYRRMWRDISEHGVWSGELWDKSKTGRIFPMTATISAVKNEEQVITNYICHVIDISEKKNTEEHIYNLAYRDVLTGLPNRQMLENLLESALAESARNGRVGAMILVDIDKFDIVNSALGVNYGNILLLEVAHRIRALVKENNTVARIGACNFAIILVDAGEDIVDAHQRIDLITSELQSSSHNTFLLGEHSHYNSLSIGICLFEGKHVKSDIVLQRSTVALLQARSTGASRCQYFDLQLETTLQARTSLEGDLRLATGLGQLELYYQLQVDQDKRPVGVEALIRWNHPKIGIVSPLQFIPIAEEGDLILEIGDWIIDSACSQLTRWCADDRTKDLTIAINISAKQFLQSNFVETIKLAIGRHGINPDNLKLELTETLVISDINSVIEKMLTIRDVLGVKISLDDFGTGYSSLSYLKRLPINQIKIDQGFIRNMLSHSDDIILVQTFINLAKSFKLDLIAEGVETEDIYLKLIDLGCKSFQGYHFSKPIPIEKMDLLLKPGH